MTAIQMRSRVSVVQDTVAHAPARAFPRRYASAAAPMTAIAVPVCVVIPKESSEAHAIRRRPISAMRAQRTKPVRWAVFAMRRRSVGGRRGRASRWAVISHRTQDAPEMRSVCRVRSEAAAGCASMGVRVTPIAAWRRDTRVALRPRTPNAWRVSRRAPAIRNARPALYAIPHSARVLVLSTPSKWVGCAAVEKVAVRADRV